jgi:hypothetical protein
MSLNAGFIHHPAPAGLMNFKPAILTVCGPSDIFPATDKPRQENFMKKAFALSAVLLFVSAASAQNFFKGTLDAAFAKAKTENKQVLLDFNSYT